MPIRNFGNFGGNQFMNRGFGTNQMLGVNLGGQQYGQQTNFGGFGQPNVITAPPIFIGGQQPFGGGQDPLAAMDNKIAMLKKQMEYDGVMAQYEAMHAPPPPKQNKFKKLLPFLGVGAGLLLWLKKSGKKLTDVLPMLGSLGPMLGGLLKPPAAK